MMIRKKNFHLFSFFPSSALRPILYQGFLYTIGIHYKQPPAVRNFSPTSPSTFTSLFLYKNRHWWSQQPCYTHKPITNDDHHRDRQKEVYTPGFFPLLLHGGGWPCFSDCRYLVSMTRQPYLESFSFIHLSPNKKKILVRRSSVFFLSLHPFLLVIPTFTFPPMWHLFPLIEQRREREHAFFSFTFYKSLVVKR